MPRRRPSFREWRLQAAIIIAAAIAMLLLQPWNDPFRLLERSGSEFHDYFDGAGGEFTGDHNYCVRVRCSEEIFHRFARQEGLALRFTEDSPRSPLVSWSRCSEAWWTPPGSFRGVYYSYRPGRRVLLAYSNGVLYYDICVT